MARTRTPARGRWKIIGLVAFVIVDIVLVAWALTATRAAPDTSRAAAEHPAAGLATRTAAPTASTATPRPTPTQPPSAVAPTRVLAAVDANTAWRAVTGPCPATPAAMGLSSDGGATWTQVDASAATKSSSVIRIIPDSAAQVSAITLASQGCTPQYIRSYVSGTNWAMYNSQLSGVWYAVPATPTVIHSPQGNVTAPCPTVIGVAPRDAATAAVLCSDHTVYRTSNAGAAWGSPTLVSGAVALTDFADGYSVAVTGQPACAGVAIAHLDAGTGAASVTGCYATSAPAPGQVAVSSGGSTLWLWAGDAVKRSSDDGASWE